MKVAVPNDTTNEARALTLLEKNGFFKLKADAGLTATKNDIEENPLNVIVAFKLYETQKYMSILNYTYSSMVHVVNKKSWDKLTPAQQKIVAEESAAAAKLARKTLRDNEAVQLKDLETSKGIVVARPELGPWKAAMGPAWDKVKARVGADNFKRFMEMVDKNSK